jgi:hypothetical protein
LIVTASTDKTVKFFDPSSQPYNLNDPKNIPHVKYKPGYYMPLQEENTIKNMPFCKVKQMFTGANASCFGITNLTVNVSQQEGEGTRRQSCIEWLIILNLNKTSFVNNKKVHSGNIHVYGIERM